MSDTAKDLDWLNDVLTDLPVERDEMTIGDLNRCLTKPIVGRDIVLRSERFPGYGAASEHSRTTPARRRRLPW